MTKAIGKDWGPGDWGTGDPSADLIMMRQKFLYPCIKLILPFFAWMIIFHDFLLRHNTINHDTIPHYTGVKFFINNLLNGVFPLWDPFIYLGSPFYGMIINGFFNPLIYSVGIAVMLGCDYYQAYLIYLVLSFFLVSLGFYLLSREILRNDFYAFLAYLIFIFSGIGTMIFTQINMLLVLIPAVWFFYFLLRFLRSFQKGDLLGLTFSVMIMLTSYLPFHTFTLIAVFILAGSVINLREMIRCAQKSFAFATAQAGTVIFCILAVLVAAVPLFLNKIADSKSDTVHPARHCVDKDIKQCYDDTMGGHFELSYPETVKYGTLGERVSLRSLFSHLDKNSYGSDGLFYLPIFAYLLIFLAIAGRLNKNGMVLLIIAVVLAVIALGGAMPFHRMLFEYVPYFKYFRNLFFFMVFLMPILILFAVNQLKSFLEQKPTTGAARIVLLVLISILHFIFFRFLLRQEAVFISSFWTVGASWFFFVFYFLGYIKAESTAFQWMLVALTVVQPIQFFSCFNKNADEYACQLPTQHTELSFAYQRPAQYPEIKCLATRFHTYIKEFWYDALLKDGPGIVGFPGAVSRGVFYLSTHMDRGTLAEYVRNKFILYDEVKPFQETDPDLFRLIKAIVGRLNVAFVTAPDELLLKKFQNQNQSAPFSVVSALSTDFRVSHFDVNDVEFTSNFDTDKFLVYTDSFHPGWKVLINGKPARLYQANAAFKGIWVPKGPRTIQLKYSPLGGTGIYVFVMVFFVLFFIYVVSQIWSRETKGLDVNPK